MLDLGRITEGIGEQIPFTLNNLLIMAYQLTSKKTKLTWTDIFLSKLVNGPIWDILNICNVRNIFQVSQSHYFITLTGIKYTLVQFLAVCVISLCGYHSGASSMQAQHDPSMLLRFGNQAPVRKDYCDVNPVVLSLRLVHGSINLRNKKKRSVTCFTKVGIYNSCCFE